MELALRHQIVYETKGVVPVEVVAKALLANDALLRKAISVLGGCVPGSEVSIRSIGIRELGNASPLKGVLAAAVFLTYQQDLQEEVPKLVEMITGWQVPENLNTLVTVLVLVVAIYAVEAAVSKIAGKKNTARLTRKYESLVERAAEIAGLPPSAIRECVETYVKPEQEKRLVDKALNLFLPSKVEGNAPILLPNGERIESEVVADVPLGTPRPEEPEAGAYDLEGVSVEFHRADRDQNKHGWRAVISSVSDRKIRTELDETIEPAALYGVTSVIGDVTVIEGRDEDTGQIGPRVYRINNVRAAS